MHLYIPPGINVLLVISMESAVRDTHLLYFYGFFGHFMLFCKNKITSAAIYHRHQGESNNNISQRNVYQDLGIFL